VNLRNIAHFCKPDFILSLTAFQNPPHRAGSSAELLPSESSGTLVTLASLAQEPPPKILDERLGSVERFSDLLSSGMFTPSGRRSTFPPECHATPAE
jgi:hypothetical protein